MKHLSASSFGPERCLVTISCFVVSSNRGTMALLHATQGGLGGTTQPIQVYPIIYYHHHLFSSARSAIYRFFFFALRVLLRSLRSGRICVKNMGKREVSARTTQNHWKTLYSKTTAIEKTFFCTSAEFVAGEACVNTCVNRRFATPLGSTGRVF